MSDKVASQKQDSSSQDWQISKLTSVERAKHLLETGLYADCEFLVGDDEKDGTEKELIKAHKIFMVMSSPVFEAMFYGKMTQEANSNKNEPINISDSTPEIFRDLLQYIYTDRINLDSMDQATSLCYVAKKYILPDLVAKCLQFVHKHLCPEYTCRLLEFSKLIDDEHLTTKCLSLFREKTREVLVDPDFEDLSESTVMSIVKDDALNINELELFDAVIRWAKIQCTRREYEIKRTTMRHMLGDLINEIRFLSMTSEEFASTPVLSGILTEKECMAIFMNLNNPDSLPMPLHLSSSRTQRRPASSTFSSTSTTKNPGINCVIRKVKNGCFGFLKADMPVGSLSPWYHLTGVTSFIADQDVKIKGIIIAEMILNEQEAFNGKDVVLECHLLDSRGFKLASAISGVSPPWSKHSITIEPVFNQPFRVERNTMYSIKVSISNHRPQFLLGMTLPDVVSCQGVKFLFPPCNSKNDLVRGIILSL